VETAQQEEVYISELDKPEESTEEEQEIESDTPPIENPEDEIVEEDEEIGYWIGYTKLDKNYSSLI